jgi:DNA-binding NtrC family response regulator
MVPHPAVLLVIADNDLRALTRSALDRRGENVEAARDAVEAIPLLRQRRFGAVVVDTAMERGSAVDVINAVREQGGRTAVILLGGQTDPGPLDADPRIVLAIMRKPFEFEMLVQIVGALCDKMRTADQSGRAADPSHLAN